MGYPKCSSCGHEIYDSGVAVCPFCGAAKGRGVLPAARGGPGRKTGPAVVRVMLAIAMMGGVISFLAARYDEPEGKGGTEAVQVQEQIIDPVPEHAPEEIPDQFAEHADCYERMWMILDSALRMQAGIDDGTLLKEDLDHLEAAIRGSCPETGETYIVDFVDRSVTVACPSHGPISGEW
jgi:hypothetical protein